jgi:hypothetical protein
MDILRLGRRFAEVQCRIENFPLAKVSGAFLDGIEAALDKAEAARKEAQL